MLSYQHAYHAGNAADLHKHGLFAWMLGYMAAKPKPMSVIETHAGRGLYDLAAPEAAKTGEAAAGIGRADGWFAEDHPYARALARVRAAHGDTAYPGSPLIAAGLLRPGDRLHLAELHPAEHAALTRAMAGTGAEIVREDGVAFARRLCPPDPRRGLVLVDPSWEVKEEYRTIPALVRRLRRVWPVGVIAMWYPILPDDRHREMIEALSAVLPGALRHEVPVPQPRPGKGMTGSGLFVVNPPWGLAEEAARLSDLFAARREAAR